MASDRCGQSRTRARCPVCGAVSSESVRPFCSRRCADVDLARWLGGAYAIAGDAADGGDGTVQDGAGQDGAGQAEDEDL